MYIGTIKLKKNLLGKIGDFSYALYIYAFPIQQLTVYYLKDRLSIWTYMAIVILATTLISIVTTVVIDNNTKKLKDKIFKKA